MISEQTPQSPRRRRLPAEWEPQQAVLVSLPDSSMDWEYMLDQVGECYTGIVKALTDGGTNVVVLTQNLRSAMDLFGSFDRNLMRYVELPLNDTWVRDYGPLTVEEISMRTGGKRLAALDCGFNGWGLKFASDRDNLATLRMHESDSLFGLRYHNCRDFVIEGGSIESDGADTILTTTRCLCSPNRNGGLTKEQAALRMKSLFGADHILWIDHGALEGDDTDSHVDTLARLCPNDIIVYTGSGDASDPQYEGLDNMAVQISRFRTASGDPYNLVELPLPDPVYDEDDGHRLPATYCNYLVTDTRVLVPAYGQKAGDELARRLMKIVYPDREAVSVDCRALIRQHGSLHCATMQIPDPSRILH